MKLDLADLDLKKFFILGSVLMVIIALANLANYFIHLSVQNLWSSIAILGGVAFNLLLAWLFITQSKTAPGSLSSVETSAGWNLEEVNAQSNTKKIKLVKQ